MKIQIRKLQNRVMTPITTNLWCVQIRSKEGPVRERCSDQSQMFELFEKKITLNETLLDISKIIVHV